MYNLQRLKKKQLKLAQKVIVKDKFNKIKIIAAADQAFPNKERIISAIVSFSFPSLEEIERVYSIMKVDFPYISGFLSFREGPSIKAAFKKLKQKPDILLVDGNGILHQLQIGLASHIGVELNQPTIGVAKNLLCGKVKKGKVYFGERVVGFELKTWEHCNPIYISPGHMVSLNSSLKIAKKCLREHKLPEPLRLAHLYVNETKNKEKI